MKSIFTYKKYLFVIILLMTNTVNSQEQYQIINLGTLGGDYSVALGINDSGQIGGQSLNANNNYRAFLWQDGIMSDLGTLGGDFSGAHDINNTVQIVGQALTDSGVARAFLWQNGSMTDLGTLDSGDVSLGYGVNNSGQVVGYSQNVDSNYHKAFLWQNGGMIYLGTLGGISVALDINNSGEVVGWSRNADGLQRAFLWQNGSMTDLGTLGGNSSDAREINDSGQVVGTATNSNNISRAFIWRNGSMTDLGTIGVSHSAASINNYAQVVGISTIAPGQTTAFLWEDSIMTDLNSLIDSSSGWILRSANDINNLGQIVGWGTHNGNARAFLLTPIKYPVFIVPGIAGTYASNMLFDLSWLIQRGLPPNQYQADPLGRVYDDLIKTFENIGYERDKNLFVVNYDWRLTPGPIDNNIDGHIDGLSGASITNNQFNYGVDYFGWYMKKACEKWREDYDTELDSIDVIAHSTGGLVTRTYIQSNAYGDEYDSFNNYRLPKIRNFVMIGVPNRGASKAWNPTHDNWIADKVYRFVLSKILNRAYQKVLLGVTITGPDHNISLSSIEDSLGNPDPKLFIKQYVPTIRYLLATYNFINFGSGVTHVNNDTDRRNTIVLDLNNGYDLIPNSNPNDFLDSTKATVIYGTGESTKVLVLQRNDFGNNVVQSFTDWFPQNVPAGTKWFEDLSTTNNGDGTVPIISSANQFMGDSRANLIPFSTSDHTGLVSKQEVQSTILDLLKIPFENKDISTGSAANILNVLNVISDPVELFITDGIGRRLGYSNTTGPVTEIPNSIWTGDTDGMGYVFGSLLEPITLQLTGLGENYYVMVSIEDSGNYGGIVLEGFLALGEQQTYNITLNPLSVNESPFEIPGSYALAQNYPNPFNPTTTISYSIPQSGNVKLVVYDMLGNEVATLVNKEQAPGVYSVLFDATNLASGVYFYRIKAGSFNEVKKMILMR